MRGLPLPRACNYLYLNVVDSVRILVSNYTYRKCTVNTEANQW